MTEGWQVKRALQYLAAGWSLLAREIRSIFYDGPALFPCGGHSFGGEVRLPEGATTLISTGRLLWVDSPDACLGVALSHVRGGSLRDVHNLGHRILVVEREGERHLPVSGRGQASKQKLQGEELLGCISRD